MSNSLPEDYPYRAELIAGGVVTRAQVRATGDPKLIKKVPSLAGDGIKAVRAYEEAHPETPSAPVEPAPSQQDGEEAIARQAAEADAQRREQERREQEEHERIAREELEREEAARLAAQAEARRKAEEEERARSEQPRRVRVKVENLGPNRLKEGTVTDDPQVVALLDKPYGHTLVEEVEES